MKKSIYEGVIKDTLNTSLFIVDLVGIRKYENTTLINICK